MPRSFAPGLRAHWVDIQTGATPQGPQGEDRTETTEMSRRWGGTREGHPLPSAAQRGTLASMSGDKEETYLERLQRWAHEAQLRKALQTSGIPVPPESAEYEDSTPTYGLSGSPTPGSETEREYMKRIEREWSPRITATPAPGDRDAQEYLKFGYDQLYGGADGWIQVKLPEFRSQPWMSELKPAPRGSTGAEYMRRSKPLGPMRFYEAIEAIRETQRTEWELWEHQRFYGFSAYDMTNRQIVHPLAIATRQMVIEETCRVAQPVSIPEWKKFLRGDLDVWIS